MSQIFSQKKVKLTSDKQLVKTLGEKIVNKYTVRNILLEKFVRNSCKLQ